MCQLDCVMSKRHIIAIAGFKGSGKDTIGEILKKKYGFASTSFAKSLKNALCAMFGWQPHMMEGISPESRQWREQPDPYWSAQFNRNITPRNMMQEFGTEVVRGNLLDSFWISATKKELVNISYPKSVVVTDARFRNELNMIRSLNGITIRVVRNTEPAWFAQAERVNKHSGWIKKALLWIYPQVRKIHPSERDWIGYDFDYIVYNNGTLADLEKQIDQIMDILNKQSR